MQPLKNIKSLPVLMVLTIIAIAAFQFYWLQKAYERESKTLDRQTNMFFAETVFSLQASKLKLDRLADSSKGTKIFIRTEATGNSLQRHPMDQKMVRMMNAMVEKAKDSNNRTIIINQNTNDSVRLTNKTFQRRERLMQFMFDLDSLQDSIKVKELHQAYTAKLNKENIDVPFSIIRVIATDSEERIFNEVTLGFKNPITYYPCFTR